MTVKTEEFPKMAAAMSGVLRAGLRQKTKTIVNLPRLLGGWRFSSDSTVSNNETDAGTTDNNKVNSSTTAKPKKESTLSKFVRAVELWDDKYEVDAHSQEPTETEDLKEEQGPSFASMLRNSKLFQLGHPAGRVVVGRIFEVQGDDLYIDFGGKFYCVCKTPQLRPHEYRRGTEVKLLLQDLEMSAAFLGSTKHITLLEADATLIGRRRNPPPSSSS